MTTNSMCNRIIMTDALTMTKPAGESPAGFSFSALTRMAKIQDIIYGMRAHEEGDLQRISTKKISA